MTATETSIAAAETAKQARQAGQAERYAELVEHLATGTTVAGDQVLEILEAAGKTEDDLLADVAEIEGLKQFPVISKRLKTLRKQKAELIEDIDKLKHQYATITLTREKRELDLHQITAQIDQLSNRRSEMLSKHPELVPELADAKRVFRHYAHLSNTLGSQLNEAKEAALSQRERLKRLYRDRDRNHPDFSGSRRQTLVDRIQAAEESAAESQKRVDDLEQEFAETVRKRDAARRKMHQL